jgi:hypothetical protein
VGGTPTTTPTSGSANTGGGAGGGGVTSSFSSQTGGSGLVAIRWNASQAVATLSSGLSFTRTNSGTDTIITITGGTGTVTFN